jgi:hypothetical protein
MPADHYHRDLRDYLEAIISLSMVPGPAGRIEPAGVAASPGVQARGYRPGGTRGGAAAGIGSAAQ